MSEYPPIETVDFHTHLSEEPDIEFQQRLSSFNVGEIASGYVERLNEYDIDHAVAIVMDEDFLHDSDSLATLLDVRDQTERFSLVFLLDPFRDDFPELVERIAKIDALGVKFHPYLQEFDSRSDPEVIGTAFDRIEANDLLTIIDTNYAGEYLFRYDGVRLGHAMAREVTTPVVLAHAGNARILDAFAVARHNENIWLDTSFTLPYWVGSSVGQDFAFCMEKFRMNRWVWGSDAPSLDPEVCRSDVREFLRDYGLSKWEDKLFSRNAKQLLD